MSKILVFFFYDWPYRLFNILSFYLFIFPVPPTSVEIVDHKVGARIQTRENEEIVLQCVVRNAKPAAEIVWFKRNMEIKFGNNQLNKRSLPKIVDSS